MNRKNRNEFETKPQCLTCLCLLTLSAVILLNKQEPEERHKDKKEGGKHGAVRQKNNKQKAFVRSNISCVCVCKIDRSSEKKKETAKKEMKKQKRL